MADGAEPCLALQGHPGAGGRRGFLRPPAPVRGRGGEERRLAWLQPPPPATLEPFPTPPAGALPSGMSRRGPVSRTREPRRRIYLLCGRISAPSAQVCALAGPGRLRFGFDNRRSGRASRGDPLGSRPAGGGAGRRLGPVLAAVERGLEAEKRRERAVALTVLKLQPLAGWVRLGDALETQGGVWPVPPPGIFRSPAPAPSGSAAPRPPTPVLPEEPSSLDPTQQSHTFRTWKCGLTARELSRPPRPSSGFPRLARHPSFRGQAAGVSRSSACCFAGCTTHPPHNPGGGAGPLDTEEGRGRAALPCHA